MTPNLKTERSNDCGMPDTQKTALIGVFITALVTAQVISSKLLYVSLPILGVVAMPGGTLAYAFTFFSTDVLNEVYGEEIAKQTVNVGFAMNFVFLALLYVAIEWPRVGGVPQEMFAGTLTPATNIVLGSLTAFVVSQHTDVRLFNRLRSQTDGKMLWLRNIGSTAVSQAIDTAIFTVIAFIVAPAAFGIGSGLPIAVVGTLILGQYIVKALIVLIDTLLVYATVRVIR